MRIHPDANELGDELREALLGPELDLAPLLEELRLVSEDLELSELVEVAQPSVADAR